MVIAAAAQQIEQSQAGNRAIRMICLLQSKLSFAIQE